MIFAVKFGYFYVTGFLVCIKPRHPIVIRSYFIQPFYMQIEILFSFDYKKVNYMKNHVLKLCKMQVFLFLCLLPMPVLSMLNNSSKRFYSHAQNMISGAFNQKYTKHLIDLNSRFKVHNMNYISDLIVDAQDNPLLQNVLGLCRNYENELIVSMCNADDKGMNCFTAALAIHNDYKKNMLNNMNRYHKVFQIIMHLKFQ